MKFVQKWDLTIPTTMKHGKVADCSLREWDSREAKKNYHDKKWQIILEIKNWFDSYFMKIFKPNVTVVFWPKTSNLDFMF